MKLNHGTRTFRFRLVSRLMAICLGLLLVLPASSQVVKKSKTPLMGWASWNQFGVRISDSLLRATADAMVNSGLAAVGFTYLNIDDGFFNGRYPNGNLRIDSVKFPYGMKALVDYLHAKGLKAGFYSEAGANTCGSQYSGTPGGFGGGMFNHDQQDADLFFKNWGFDFLKVDYCGGLVQKLDEKTRYSAIKKAIDNTGRKDINFNACRWQFPGTWITEIADSWRMSHDINFAPGSKAQWKSIISIIDLNKYLAPYAKPGHYNDMDMLEVGRGLTADEDKSHFSMWCILSSPLVLGNDLTKMSPETQAILTNPEVIAVNQDTTGLQAQLIADNGAGLQVWAKPLNGKLSHERAVVLFNRTEAPASISVRWRELNLEGAARVRNLWARTDLGSFDSVYTETVPPHGVAMLKVVGEKARLQDVFEAEYAWINNFNLTQFGEIVSGQGRVIPDKNCSGRAKVGWLGNRADNFIEFRDIYAKAAGTSKLTISYISAETQNMVVSVNGAETKLSDLNSQRAIARHTMQVKLKKGYNTIRFFNANAWMPDLDKIQLDLN